MLHVEDDPSTVELVRRVLAARPNVTVVPVSDGREVVNRARDARPDLMLVDLHVGGVTGEDLLTALRSSDETAGVPIIVLSAGAGDEVAGSGDAGVPVADAVLGKPFRHEELLHAIDALLAEDRPVAGAASATAPPVLDPEVIAALDDLAARSGAEVTDLVRAALDDARALLDSLDDAASEGDLQRVLDATHALRGALGNFGASNVVDHCDDIGALARAGDAELLRHALDQLRSAVHGAEAALVQHFELS